MVTTGRQGGASKRRCDRRPGGAVRPARGAGGAAMGSQGSPVKSYDYLLKFLLVGDSDVGKGEILESLQDGAAESPYAYSNGIDYKTTTILLDGRRVKLELWDTSGQGRFCTIFRSYSRGAQGILLVYDITNRWSFDGIDRWIKEIDEVGLGPGCPPGEVRLDGGAWAPGRLWIPACHPSCGPGSAPCTVPRPTPGLAGHCARNGRAWSPARPGTTGPPGRAYSVGPEPWTSHGPHPVIGQTGRALLRLWVGGALRLCLC
ncbi:PREDICTED: ras-related protein Rab-40C isoform X2 [Rhinopithecus bieti]|uniref:ras-related protein Rab-40C isoform X2 n=1 Tax=Rhinopithecus bieti TaxID=61621 RepID=UPI00083BBD49|nr:PREDICTED: ras-related protein Rab-40C isoform X2 [Rhinopithecus bieti]